MAELRITNNFDELKKSADNLHNTVKKVKKDTNELNEIKSRDNIFTQAYKGLNKADKAIAQIKAQMVGLSEGSKTLLALQKQENKYLYQKQKILTDMKTISNAMISSDNKSIQLEGQKIQTQINGYKQQQKIYNGIQQSNRMRERGNQLEQENLEIIKRQNRERVESEKRLAQLREELQSLSRMMYDQENALKTGKKNKTPVDMDWAIEKYKDDYAEAEKLMKLLGDDNGEVQHFINGMNWTEANNPFRVMRDEATKLIPKIVESEKALAKLNADPSKNSNQIENIKKDVEIYRTEWNKALDEIHAKVEEYAMQRNADGTLMHSDEEIARMKTTETNLRNQLKILTDIAVRKQQATNVDNAQAQKEKEYLSLLQQKFQLENKIVGLSKDKDSIKKNQNQIKEYQKQIQLINQKLQEIEKETTLTKKTKKAVDDATQAHKNEQSAIIAKNKDIENTNGLLSDTLKNFMKFTVYYTALNVLKQGINEALETMKDLDKAFTDIQMVTNGTDEETAKLAKEYNGLAKELGATTVEVAEGAGEWFNESRDHLKTLELLETRED